MHDHSDIERNDGFDLDRFLPYRLNHLADRISQALARLYEESYGLNVAQWRVLAWLRQCDELTARQICQSTHMDKARVSRAVAKLVERDLISRNPASHDQRHHHLRLTVAGRDLLRDLIPQARAWEAELVSTLTREEYRTLMKVMDKLEGQLSE